MQSPELNLLKLYRAHRDEIEALSDKRALFALAYLNHIGRAARTVLRSDLALNADDFVQILGTLMRAELVVAHGEMLSVTPLGQRVLEEIGITSGSPPPSHNPPKPVRGSPTSGGFGWLVGALVAVGLLTVGLFILHNWISSWPKPITPVPTESAVDAPVAANTPGAKSPPVDTATFTPQPSPTQSPTGGGLVASATPVPTTPSAAGQRIAVTPTPQITLPTTLLDSTSPVILPNINGVLGSNGWYVSDVTVVWTVTDPDSPVTSTSGCNSTKISTDTASTLLTCTAASTGGTSSKSVIIQRDATKPTITASAIKADNRPYTPGTWTNQSVTVHFTCRDAGSTVASCPADVPLSAEGVTSSVSGTARDNAGNSASASFGPVQIDKTKPTFSNVKATPNPVYYSVGGYTSCSSAQKTKLVITSDVSDKGSITSVVVNYYYYRVNNTASSPQRVPMTLKYDFSGGNFFFYYAATIDVGNEAFNYLGIQGGQIRYWVSATDAAGNRSESSQQIVMVVRCGTAVPS